LPNSSNIAAAVRFASYVPRHQLVEDTMADPFMEHSFSCMVEKVSDYAIFLLDHAGVIQTWNPAAEVMKGYPRGEALGRNFSMLYTEEDQRCNRPQNNLEQLPNTAPSRNRHGGNARTARCSGR
jgi:PAS domain S-box-containing protein